MESVPTSPMPTTSTDKKKPLDDSESHGGQIDDDMCSTVTPNKLLARIKKTSVHWDLERFCRQEEYVASVACQLKRTHKDRLKNIKWLLKRAEEVEEEAATFMQGMYARGEQPWYTYFKKILYQHKLRLEKQKKVAAIKFKMDTERRRAAVVTKKVPSPPGRPHLFCRDTLGRVSYAPRDM